MSVAGTGVIYAIVNTVSGGFYIGSTIDPAARRYAHFYSLGKGNRKLRAAVKKYGAEAFQWVAVAEVPGPDLRATEGRLLQRLVGHPKCYNISLEAWPTRWEVNTSEARAKISDGVRAYLARRTPPAPITHCKRGHEYTPENTLYRKKGGRACRTCQAWHNREYRARVKPWRSPELKAKREAWRQRRKSDRAQHKPAVQHCRNGHPRTEENIYVSPDGVRNCRLCRRRNNYKYKKWQKPEHKAYMREWGKRKRARLKQSE